MLNNLGIVQACFHLPRFRNNAARRLGGRSILEWVIRRVTDSMRLDGVIVEACANVDYYAFQHLVPRDVPVCLCEGDDPLARFCKAMEQYPAEGAVRIQGDDLFIDPEMIDRLVATAEAHPGCDYVGFCSRDGRPAILSPVGVYAEWFRAAALHKANRQARDRHDREHVTRYIYSHPEEFNLRLIPAPAEIDRDDVRLTVDIEEDWDNALVLFEALGSEHLDWQRIARLLDHQPALRSRMAALNRVHAQV
ncbi:MAG: NTP transferase domain-containing protein [Pirellulales bacterium]|nr:NTP transferase domain-containing protein [Pirellulales bacterium]